MNIVVLLGRLTKEPEIRYTQTGKVVTTFTLAVDRPFTNADGQREADFINCVVWGKTAEAVANYVSKGQRLAVTGRLQIRSYEAKDGGKRYVTEVIVSSVQFIERKEQAAMNNNTHEKADFESFGVQGQQEDFKFDEEIPF